MGETVVLDGVAAPDDIPTQIGMLRRQFTDAEESRFGLVTVEDVQHQRRDLGIGAVVYSDRHLATPCGIPGQARDVRSQHRAARNQSGNHKDHVVEDDDTRCPCPQTGSPQGDEKTAEEHQQGKMDGGRRFPVVAGEKNHYGHGIRFCAALYNAGPVHHLY